VTFYESRKSRLKVRVVETVGLVLGAIICAVAPFPSETIERVYSTGLYLTIQTYLTTASNTIPRVADIRCLLRFPSGS
jgi:hypothetical protein